MDKVFIEKWVYISKEENGDPSKLVGALLAKNTGEKFVWFPKYGEIFEIIEYLCRKEDFRYPRGKGRHYLLNEINKLGKKKSPEIIVEESLIPRSYKCKPVIDTEEELRLEFREELLIELKDIDLQGLTGQIPLVEFMRGVSDVE